MLFLAPLCLVKQIAMFDAEVPPLESPERCDGKPDEKFDLFLASVPLNLVEL